MRRLRHADCNYFNEIRFLCFRRTATLTSFRIAMSYNIMYELCKPTIQADEHPLIRDRMNPRTTVYAKPAKTECHSKYENI